MTFHQGLAALGGSWGQLLLVVVSAIAIYLAFMLYVRLFGARVLSNVTSFDAVVVIMFGAVAGRAILGETPTLLAGILGLGTLMGMEALFGSLRQHFGRFRVVGHQARVLMAHGTILSRAARAAHVSRSDILVSLRRAGISRFDQVQCVILEPNGALSVIREGEPIDARLLEGVHNAEAVLDPEDGHGTA